MEIFNLNSFLFGVLIAVAGCTPALLWIILCLIYKIRFLRVGFLYPPSIHTTYIHNTEFLLGILPFGSFIRPLGYDHNEETSEIEKSDINHSFRNKSKIFKFLFPLIPAITTLFLIITTTNLISFPLINVCEDLISLASLLLTDLCTWNSKSFDTLDNLIIKYNRNIFVSFIFLFSVLISNISGLINVKIKYKNLRFISQNIYVIILILFYIILPIFLYLHYRPNDITIYLSNTLIGIYSTSAVYYTITILLLKQTLNYKIIK